MATIDQIMDYESGKMSDAEVVRFFADLVKTGMAWSLQGHYGRSAQALIDAGILDAQGNVLIELED